jgi:GTP1/Obg family GTP-binding protein
MIGCECRTIVSRSPLNIYKVLTPALDKMHPFLRVLADILVSILTQMAMKKLSPVRFALQLWRFFSIIACILVRFGF